MAKKQVVARNRGPVPLRRRRAPAPPQPKKKAVNGNRKRNPPRSPGAFLPRQMKLPSPPGSTPTIALACRDCRTFFATSLATMGSTGITLFVDPCPGKPTSLYYLDGTATSTSLMGTTAWTPVIPSTPSKVFGITSSGGKYRTVSCSYVLKYTGSLFESKGVCYVYNGHAPDGDTTPQQLFDGITSNVRTKTYSMMELAKGVKFDCNYTTEVGRRLYVAGERVTSDTLENDHPAFPTTEFATNPEHINIGGVWDLGIILCNGMSAGASITVECITNIEMLPPMELTGLATPVASAKSWYNPF